MDTSNLNRLLTAIAISLPLLGGTNASLAGNADVVDVSVTALGGSRFRIDTTVAHADTGWDHYANRWDVFTEDGMVLGTRELLHPHVDEQPFTRSLTLEIPADITRIVVRAGDSVHGDEGGASLTVDVPH